MKKKLIDFYKKKIIILIIYIKINDINIFQRIFYDNKIIIQFFSFLSLLKSRDCSINIKNRKHKISRKKFLNFYIIKFYRYIF